MTDRLPTRRQFLARTGLAAALAPAALARAAQPADKPRGKADACIFLWLGGGAAHIDTFDPKRPGDRQARREGLLSRLTAEQLARHEGEKSLREYATAAATGLRMAGPDFMKVFDLGTESADLRQRYGGDFGQRCLLARRLVEAGVRFVEVGFTMNFINGTGW